MKINILLIGGFNKARSLGESLLQKGYRVTVINMDKKDCKKLAEIQNMNVIWGNGGKAFILEDANITNMDIVIAMTPKDEDNYVISQFCKRKYNVKKVVALVSDPRKSDFFYKMGVDRVVCAMNAITNIIEEQALMDRLTTMMPVTNGRICILEIPILASADVNGKKLSEINLPEGVIVGCIVHGDESFVPSGETRLSFGDIIVLISKKDELENAVQILTGSVVS